MRYTDDFTFKGLIDKSAYYLHMATYNIVRADMNSELNASDTITFWTARKYMDH